MSASRGLHVRQTDARMRGLAPASRIHFSATSPHGHGSALPSILYHMVPTPGSVVSTAVARFR